MSKPNRFLHRMGFIISPSLTFTGVGPYNNPIAKRNWRKFRKRHEEALRWTSDKETEDDE